MDHKFREDLDLVAKFTICENDLEHRNYPEMPYFEALQLGVDWFTIIFFWKGQHPYYSTVRKKAQIYGSREI